MEIISSFNGKPYFLIETETGIFHAVEKYVSTDEGKNYRPYYFEDIGALTSGLDIKEVPNRGISILVKIPIDQGNNWITCIVEECRKHASIASSDYVSVEKFGQFLSKLIHASSMENYHEVVPRLFRKIVND